MLEPDHPGAFDVSTAPIYFVSATARPDALNQWQHYSGSQGFALALLTTDELAPVGVPDQIDPMLELPPYWSPPNWYDVLYAPDVQQLVVDEADPAEPLPIQWVMGAPLSASERLPITDATARLLRANGLPGDVRWSEVSYRF